jgi:hypothetical protein
MGTREELIIRLMTERGMTAEQAIREADRAMPKSAPRRVVESSAEIVDGVLSPVATVASESADVAKRVTRTVFGMWKP